MAYAHCRGQKTDSRRQMVQKSAVKSIYLALAHRYSESIDTSTGVEEEDGIVDPRDLG